MADVILQIDAVLARIEGKLAKVKAAQGSKVKLTRAEIDLLTSLEEVRDLMLNVVKSGDREVLITVFGGDCSRSGRVHAVLDTVVLSPMNANDQRLPTCQRACNGVERVLVDIGHKEDLDKAIAVEKAKLEEEKAERKATLEMAELEAEAKSKAEEEKAAAAAAEEEALGAQLSEHKKKTSDEIKDTLEKGVGVMRDTFSYEYPAGADAARVEEATQGFSGLFDGVTKLAVEFRTNEEFDDHLGKYKLDWPKIILFLNGMYADKACAQYRSRIQFCIGKLMDTSPDFLEALAQQPEVMDALLKEQKDEDDKFSDQKPGVVWVDYKAKAYQGNELLNGNPKLVLKGFCDDAKSKDCVTREERLAYIIDRASSPTARVACVICNKRHLRMFAEIKDYCESMSLLSPEFVIVTRKGYDPEEFTKLGIRPDMVTTDWNEAAKLAVGVIDALS